MSISQMVLPEFDREMANTRKVLERIPPDKLGWKVHEKSNTIGWVAMHLADLPGWIEMTFGNDSLDIAPAGAEPYRTPAVESVPQILERFDKNVAAGRLILEAASDDDFAKPWSLLRTGTVVFTMPRSAVLRNFVMNHSVHHRAHLCVYLRLNDVPVPGLYGPSADETTF
jgi:uncharacterized damage-inducible protein DinB